MDSIVFQTRKILSVLIKYIFHAIM